MRKSIFDIASASINISNEVDRIVSMSIKEKCTYSSPYNRTLFEFVDERCFRDWSYRGHFVNVDDFLEAVNYKEIIIAAQNGDSEAFMTLIELTYNLWNLAYHDIIDEKSASGWNNNFFHLRDVMLDNIEKYNHKAYIDDERILIIEDKPEVTTVAEIIEHDLAIDIIRYNHRSMQGEIELKKKILIALGLELEPKRKELQVLNKQLSDDIFFMLNNMNLRHNNRSKKDMTKYKEYVAKMSKARLEKWYDELYQMLLLAYLLLDNVGRTETVRDLKGKIVGGKI